MKLKIFGFFATSARATVVCKEVNSNFGQYLIDTVHAYNRDGAVTRFTDRFSKKAWGKTVPQFTTIIHE